MINTTSKNGSSLYKERKYISNIIVLTNSLCIWFSYGAVTPKTFQTQQWRKILQPLKVYRLKEQSFMSVREQSGSKRRTDSTKLFVPRSFKMKWSSRWNRRSNPSPQRKKLQNKLPIKRSFLSKIPSKWPRLKSLWDKTSRTSPMFLWWISLRKKTNLIHRAFSRRTMKSWTIAFRLGKVSHNKWNNESNQPWRTKAQQSGNYRWP